MGLADFIAARAHMLSMQLEQWKSPAELEEMQEGRFLALLKHASGTVPHYRKSLKGAKASSLDDIRILPTVGKEQARETASFISSACQPGSLVEGRTSGSTGMPLAVLSTRKELAHTDAQRYFQHSVAGIGLLDRVAFLTYRKEDAGLFKGLFGVRNLSYSRSEAESLHALKSMGPSALISYPACLIPLAKESIASGAGFQVRAVVSSAECLSDAARRLIAEAFGCGIFDRYGAIEAGSIAFECEKGRKHLYEGSIITEILDEAGNPARNGEEGEIVLTPLWRRSMPLIRYRIGDRAAFGPRCPCGRGLRTIKEVRGRSNPSIVLPSGRRFPGLSLGLALRHARGVLQFQIVQEGRESLRILIVPRGEDGGLRRQVLEAARAALPEPMEMAVVLVGRLEKGERGKLSEFVSTLRADEGV